MLSRHYEYKSDVLAPVEEVFAYADDQTRLSSHMSQSSWKMGGGEMKIESDQGRGQAVGSKIRLSGRVLGINLFVDEVVTERTAPRRKVWETIGQPRLLIIGHYRMGFEIAPRGGGSAFRVFIDYALPERGIARWLGILFGQFYARWCTKQMATDAAKHFSLAHSAGTL